MFFFNYSVKFGITNLRLYVNMYPNVANYALFLTKSIILKAMR